MYTVKASGSEGRASWRRVSGDCLVNQSVDGLGAMFRGDKGRGGSAARELARAEGASQKVEKRAAAAVASAAESAAKAEKKADKSLARAAYTSRNAEKRAAAAVASAAESVAKAEKKAERKVCKSLAHVAHAKQKAEKRAAAAVASAAEKVAKTEKKAERSAKRAKVAESSAAASAAESKALFSGDAKSPRLTKKGRALAAELTAQSAGEHATEVERLMRHKTSVAVAREKVEKLAKIVSDKAEKLKGQRDKARRERRRSEQKLAKSLAATEKLKNGGVVSEKRSIHKLPEAVQALIEAADADTVKAEEVAEKRQEKIEDLIAEVQALRQKLDAKSLVEFDRLRHPTSGQSLTLEELLGKGNEAYSQGIVELALRLMSSCLSGGQAVSVVRAFVTALHPDRKEGRDYRIPSARRFNEWRRYLEPICHYLAVTTIKLAVRTHLSNDATTKNHIHILMAVYRCELPDGRVVDVVRSAATETSALTLPA